MLTDVDSLVLFSQRPSDPYELPYGESFYHSYPYLASQPEMPQFSFCLCHPAQHQILGKMHFYQRGNQAISQLYAPFGSFDGGPVSREVAEYFLSFVLKTLKGQAIKEIFVHHPSPCYQVDPIWGKLLVDMGFSVKSTANHHIIVDENPLAQKLHYMERRKLTPSHQFVFDVQPTGRLYYVYSFIEACRKERKQKLSLSYRRLCRVVHNSPGHFMLCTVSSGKKLAAAAIIIKVNTHCWYQFYPAHSQQFNKESPLVFLLSELYNCAQNQQVQALDLGTSEVEGVPLQGLIKFKSRMGGIATFKRVFFKSL